MLIIVFGLAGAGKSFVSKEIAKLYNFHYQEGDDWLTEDMKIAIANKNIITQKMVDDFVTRIICNIQPMLKKHKNIVISQALYRKKNRLQILEHFPQAIFIEIKASQETINRRLAFRGGEVTISFAAGMAKEFEPGFANIEIINDLEGNANVVTNKKLRDVVNFHLLNEGDTSNGATI